MLELCASVHSYHALFSFPFNWNFSVQTCESEIHRACAGPPWSLFDPNEDAEGEEALWICQGCSTIAGEAPPPPSPEVRVLSPVTATSTSHLANVDLNIFDLYGFFLNIFKL